MELDLGAITAQARQAAAELLEVAKLEEGALFVVGCSSSEIVGGQIGHASSLEAAQAVFAGIYPLLRERGIWLAAQCCEHLNRALILEWDCARQYGYDPVCVVPQPKAGGPSPPPPGAALPPLWRWSTSGLTRGWTSAAPSSGCTCGMWRCRCG